MLRQFSIREQGARRRNGYHLQRASKKRTFILEKVGDDDHAHHLWNEVSSSSLGVHHIIIVSGNDISVIIMTDVTQKFVGSLIDSLNGTQRCDPVTG